MIRTSQQYAKAFVEARRISGVADDILIANLLSSVDKHNDRRKLSSILNEIEKLLIKERGGSHIVVTSARTLKPEMQSAIEGAKNPDDVMTFSIDPSLVAGMRIAKDNEHELDYSFSRAVSRLFQ